MKKLPPLLEPNLAKTKSMEKHSGIRVPIKVTERDGSLHNRTPDLAQHWVAFDDYNPEALDQLDPELTNTFVAGYEAYQRRVGQAVKLRHEAIFHAKH